MRTDAVSDRIDASVVKNAPVAHTAEAAGRCYHDGASGG